MSNFSRLLLLIIFICLIALLISACESPLTQEQVKPLKPCEVENTFTGPIDWQISTFTREQRCEGYVLTIEGANKVHRVTHECNEVIATLESSPGVYKVGLVACGQYASGTPCTITIQTPTQTIVLETRIGTMNNITL